MRLGRWGGGVLAAAIACGASAAGAPAAGAAGEPPMRLPAPAGAASEPGSWILGVRGTPTRAEAAGLRAQRRGRALVVPRARARQAARALERRGRLLYAEPDVRLRRASAFESDPGGWARGAVVDPGLAWPATSGPIAVIDDFADPSRPDLAGRVTFLNEGTGVLAGPHGTQVASAAAGTAGNGGVIGVNPGAPILSYQPDELTCSDVSDGVLAAARARAPVINLSLGSASDCFTLYAATQIAFAAGSIVVAAAGNEYAEGNPVIYPAAYPHVLSVAAVGPTLESSDFSSAGTAVDVSAPGEAVPVATPLAFDTGDGAVDGFARVDGTSFSAPMVAGAAAWVRAARPGLTGDQVADLVRGTAQDLGPRGWDRDTGFGLVDLRAALAAPAPAIDPSEPNDLISFVDGRVFTAPDPYLWRGGARRSLRAAVDAAEDPADVYRIRIPGRARVSISVAPSSGDPDLAVLSSAARSIDDRRATIARSRRPGRATDRVVVVNRARSARLAYVVVVPFARDYLDARYRLTVARARR